MKLRLFFAFVLFAAVSFCTVSFAEEPKPDKEGFIPLFNGKDLNGWEGNTDIWSVDNGCIIGKTENEGPKKLTYNTFLILKDKEYDNFVLKFDIRLSKDGNSGVQYRSRLNKDPNRPWSVSGYQADFDGNHAHSGILYGEGFGGILANRGQETELGENRRPKLIENFADGNELKKAIKVEEWNEYEITAKDFTFTNRINGKVMSICTDKDEANRKSTGIIAIQAHVGPPMKVEIRNIRIKPL